MPHRGTIEKDKIKLIKHAFIRCAFTNVSRFSTSNWRSCQLHDDVMYWGETGGYGLHYSWNGDQKVVTRELYVLKEIGLKIMRLQWSHFSWTQQTWRHSKAPVDTFCACFTLKDSQYGADLTIRNNSFKYNTQDKSRVKRHH